MNVSKSIIGKQLIALTIAIFFVFPAFVSLDHATKNHDHYDTCDFSDTHVHSTKLDCDLGDLHFLDKGIFAFAKAYHFTQPDFVEFPTKYTTPSYFQLVNITSDRGPPAI